MRSEIFKVLTNGHFFIHSFRLEEKKAPTGGGATTTKTKGVAPSRGGATRSALPLVSLSQRSAVPTSQVPPRGDLRQKENLRPTPQNEISSRSLGGLKHTDSLSSMSSQDFYQATPADQIIAPLKKIGKVEHASPPLPLHTHR